ncbi:MAG: L-histidine N(alpha)-methyltransferase [Candidatus Poribacteria bacterium]|nr:L-histidine N(alpha)-methyltransferase [Candidatus Poribacteria bacterium]
MISRFTLVAVDSETLQTTFADDVRAGLAAHPKSLPCLYFYDHAGSLLFEKICSLPEYYPTRAERQILEAWAHELVASLHPDTVLVELGSGSAVKTAILIEAFLKKHGKLRYDPIDISRTMLEESAANLLQTHRGLEIVGVAGEYFHGLRHIKETDDRPKLVLFLGSNIGNMHRDEAASFLSQIRETTTDDDLLLIGIDLRKDRAVLEAAYDDAQGVTAQFNLNLLDRINRDFDADFDLDAFSHRAVYEDEIGRVEMHLVSERAQVVRIADLGLEVAFGEGEAMHTENSYKYSTDEIARLAERSGLTLLDQRFDAKRRFSLNLLAPNLV